MTHTEKIREVVNFTKTAIEAGQAEAYLNIAKATLDVLELYVKGDITEAELVVSLHVIHAPNVVD